MQFYYFFLVFLKFDKKHYKLKNHGSSHLFRLLTTFLVGEDYDENHLPRYLALYNCNPSDLLTDTGSYTERGKRISALLREKDVIIPIL